MFGAKQQLKLVAILIVAQAGCSALGLWIHQRLVVSEAVQRARKEATVALAAETGDLLTKTAQAPAPHESEPDLDADVLRRRLESREPRHHVAWLLFDRDWRLSETLRDADRVVPSGSPDTPESSAARRAEWSPIPEVPSIGAGLHAGTLTLGRRRFIALSVDLPDHAGILAACRPEEHTAVASAAPLGTALATMVIGWVWGTGLLGMIVYLVVTKMYEELARRHARFEADTFRRIQSLVRTRDALIFGLATVAEARDEATGRHVERVAYYAARLAVAASQHPRFRARITPEFVERIAISAVLHDIGKVAIEDSILFKPGRFTEGEFERMKTHARIGGRYLAAIEQRLGNSPTLRMACEIAVHHHERWDGAGYPDGLAGEAIPLAARIVAVADTYEALSSLRDYKPPYPHEKCVEIICGERGKQFDPDLVDAFLKIEHTFRQFAYQYGEHVFSASGGDGPTPGRNTGELCTGLVSAMKTLDENWSIPSTHPAVSE